MQIITRAFKIAATGSNSPFIMAAATELENTTGVRYSFLHWANSGRRKQGTKDDAVVVWFEEKETFSIFVEIF